jgi:hypothetical protein
MENFSFFTLNSTEKSAIVQGWKIEGNKIIPHINPTLEGLRTLFKLYNINIGSVFVKNTGNEDYTLFQITPKGKVKSYAVKKEIMQPLIIHKSVCGGCTELPYNGYKDKYDWCQFSRSIANLQE